MKFNIAVVDDLEADSKCILDFTDRYFHGRRNRPNNIKCFSCSEDFLKVYRKGDYQIIFLDICMGEINGLELAGRLRKGDKDICIIFMSTTREFVFKSFNAVPEGYLCKPYEYETFAEVMDRTMQKLFAEETRLRITLPHNQIEISANEIFSILSNNHSTEIKIITGEVYHSNMLFSQLEKILENEPNFLLCSRGIIINMDYASQIKEDKLIMQDDTIFPVRRRGRKEISAKFTKYIAGRIRRRLDI